MTDKQMKYNYENEEIEDRKVRSKHGKRAKKKKKSKLKRVILTFFTVFFMILAMMIGVGVGYAYNMLTVIEEDTSFNKEDIEVNEGVKTTGYRNILLYGVDARNQKNSYDSSLSDVIMIVSINQDTKKVRIASVYRDTYLQNTKTKKFDKITHAFMQGGPQLSMSTINTNLDLDITDYVAVNFSVVVDAVDAVGGVTLDITSEEAGYINPYIDEVNKTTGHNSKHITKGGTYTLDGVQATAYSRIRYTAGRRLEEDGKTKTSIRFSISKSQKNEHW